MNSDLSQHDCNGATLCVGDKVKAKHKIEWMGGKSIPRSAIGTVKEISQQELVELGASTVRVDFGRILNTICHSSEVVLLKVNK